MLKKLLGSKGSKLFPHSISPIPPPPTSPPPHRCATAVKIFLQNVIIVDNWKIFCLIGSSKRVKTAIFLQFLWIWQSWTRERTRRRFKRAKTLWDKGKEEWEGGNLFPSSLFSVRFLYAHAKSFFILLLQVISVSLSYSSLSQMENNGLAYV